MNNRTLLQVTAICLILVLKSFSAIAQTDTSASLQQDTVAHLQTDTANTGTVYFMRKTGFIGSGTGFNVFIDSGFVCRLNEKRYSVHHVLVGSHTFSAQFAGKKSKEGAEKIVIDVEKGQTYYIQLIFQNGAFINNVYCQEVTKNSAKLILPELTEDKNYVAPK